MSTLTIGGNGGFIASRPGETAITIQNLQVQQTGAVPGFWTRPRLRRARPLIARVRDCYGYWKWLGESGPFTGSGGGE